MRRLAILAAFALLLPASAAAQDKDADRFDPKILAKPCSKTNPPPCASTAPKIIHQPDPEYSREARKLGIQGTVVLYLVVGADGRPYDIRVARSLGHGLDEAAIEAVRKWKFKPATDHGTPVPVAVNIEINFHL